MTGRIFGFTLFMLVAQLMLGRSLYASEQSGTVMPVVDANSYAVTPFVSILEDENGQWQIEDVASEQFAGRFGPTKQDYLNFGYSDSVYWIRLQVRYEPTRKRHPAVQRWYYEIGKAQLNMAELYIQQPDGTITQAQADIRIPYADRPLRMVNSVFPVTTPKGETITLYMRVKNITAFYVPLTLWNPSEFVRKISREEILYGIFYGGMIMMIVYNVFLFVSIRDLSYIYYSSYLLSALIFEAIDMGHGAAWINNGLTWFNKEYVPIAIWCTWLTAFLFTRHFLEIPRRHPLLNKFLTPLFLFSLICAAFCFMLPFKLTLIVSVYFCGYAVATMPIVGAYVWYKGNKNGSFFTLAWLFNVSGFIIYSSVATGRAPATPLFVASMPLGTLLEAVMLSFALAERIKQTQKEALNSNRMSMQHLASYRSLFDNALEGIYQISLRGKLINANPAMARILGYPNVNTLLQSGRRNIIEFFEDPSRQWRELIRGNAMRNEIQRTNTVGDMYVAMHSAQLVRDTHGRPAYIEGTLVNITERHQREQAERERIRERREKLVAEANTNAKSRFLKNMSFEIRSSLAPIIGFSETLREPALSVESKRSAVSAIMANAQTLMQLVNDILDYSKIEAGKMSIEHIDIDLFATIALIKTQFAPQASEKKLQFEVLYDWPLPARIASDPTRLKQILQNLCSNAIKYTYRGKVSLHIAWNEQSSQLCFAVSDTGPGIAPQDLRSWQDNRSWQDSRSLQDSRSVAETAEALQRGGLGIAITRQLARLLGGQFSVESTQGVGSTFSVCISCKTPPREQWVSSEVSAVTPKHLSLETPLLSGDVLLAEDNPVNQKLISRLVTKTGATVTLVSDGEQALQAALERRYDLVLMDVNMPVMGGLDATRSLRERGYEGPIFALTAEHGLEEIQASLTAGCNGHLTKPIELTNFYSVLSVCLQPKENDA